LRLEGSCKGCPSSTITMKQTIEEAILAKAPDVTGRASAHSRQSW
jgi:Fe-S cluster biogenesis protein NfuA